MRTILILEDDEGLNRGLSVKLEKEGYRIFSAFDADTARGIFRREHIDMVISDISLPHESGLEFGRWVRAESEAYLIYLTALDTELDIVNGYDSGADDYITKPFSVNVLVSKVNAQMRRLGGAQEKTVYRCGELEVYPDEMRVKRDGEELNLSRTEIKLLLCLMENAEHIVSKESILEKVWGLDGRFVDDNTVTVNISRLKSKLGTDCISNVRGLGYIWAKSVTKA